MQASQAGAVDNAAGQAERRLRWGRVLSWLFHPFVLGVPAMLAIGIARQGWRPEHTPGVALAVVIIVGTPALGIPLLVRLGLVDDLFVSVRRQRVYLYPLLLLSFVAGSLVLLRTGVDPLVVAILLSAAASLTLAGLLTVWIKLSLHCAGVGGIAASLAAAFGPWAWLALLLLVPTALGRLWARGHSLAETVAGALLGTVATRLLIAALGPLL
ncbi:MAG: hypothetical protein HY744_33860 [Deltaproteobacteria bacterium]|nr:hypothetical protein [Deltaproteobacteria bacterium]